LPTEHSALELRSPLMVACLQIQSLYIPQQQILDPSDFI